jgi:ubiquinone/menaquinone biosynthesis C-methylase UbiE
MADGKPPVSNEMRRANYDRLSRWYDLLSNSSEQPYRRLGLELLGIQAGEIVLEIGFGTGQALVDLAAASGDSGRVYGIDLSQGMRHVAQERMEQAGLAQRVALLCGDALELPFAGQSFDAAFMSFTLELFEQQEIGQVLLECRRVLRTGGRLGVVALARKPRPNWVVSLYDWAHEKFPVAIDCRPICTSEAVDAAGFQIVRCIEKTMWGLPVDALLAQNGVHSRSLFQGAQNRSVHSAPSRVDDKTRA